MHEPVTNAKHSAPGTVSTLVWCTGRAPSDIEVSACVEDMDARGAPPPNSSRFTVIDFPPGDRDHAPQGKLSTMSSSSRARSTWTWTESGERARQAFVLIDANRSGSVTASPARRRPAEGVATRAAPSVLADPRNAPAPDAEERAVERILGPQGLMGAFGRHRAEDDL